MSVLVYPSTLPQLPIIGSSEQPKSTTVRTAMDVAGVFKARQRTTKVKRQYSGLVLYLGATDMNTFDNFYVTSTGQGAIPFQWQDPRTQTTRMLKFVAAPVYDPVQNGLTKVTFDLEEP